MRLVNRLILFISLSFILPVGAHALELSDQSNNVFKFQQKLANKGNARAQYKLACMYETGTGVERDIEQAKQWYNQAATAGIKSASDRMTYLSVKQRGYDKTKDSAWLEGVKKDAGESKGDAMFLLAQLYREGIGVKKDLNKAIEILDQVSLLGAADVEDEMALIQKEVDANNKINKNLRKERQRKAASAAQQIKLKQASNEAQQGAQKAAQKVAPDANKTTQTAQQIDADKAIRAEKIKHYKEVMKKLQLEQQQIDEQQAWASGGKASSADDEI